MVNTMPASCGVTWCAAMAWIAAFFINSGLTAKTSCTSRSAPVPYLMTFSFNRVSPEITTAWPGVVDAVAERGLDFVAMIDLEGGDLQSIRGRRRPLLS
jgi:hypothetical protein